MNITEIQTTEHIVSLKNHLTIFRVKYLTENFLKKIKTPSNFYKSVSNSKQTLPNGRTNRMWWKNLNPDGFYKYKINQSYTEITMVIKSEKLVNELELKMRLKKIGNPIDVEVYKPDRNIELSELDYISREGVEKFGLKTMKVDCR
jgi:hypothetical protein